MKTSFIFIRLLIAKIFQTIKTTKETQKTTTVSLASTYKPLDGYVEACFGTKLVASCPEGKQVIITGGRLGRMRTGSCIPSNQAGSVGCYDDVKPTLSRKCDGKRVCKVDVFDLRLQIQRTIQSSCSSAYSVYLEASYMCAFGGKPDSISTTSTPSPTSPTTPTMAPTTSTTTTEKTLPPAGHTPPPGSREVCMSENFQAFCAYGKKPNIIHASYGRLRKNRCLSDSDSQMPCSIDVKGEMGYLCGNKWTCTVPMTKLTQLLNGQTNCDSSLDHYLEIKYECISGGETTPMPKKIKNVASTTAEKTIKPIETSTMVITTPEQTTTGTTEKPKYVPMIGLPSNIRLFNLSVIFVYRCETNMLEVNFSSLVFTRCYYFHSWSSLWKNESRKVYDC